MTLPLAYNIRNVRERWTVALLAVAGIALVVAVFVILTAPAAQGISFIHDRMPLILAPEQREAWLNQPDAAAKLLEEGTREFVYEPAS